MRKYTVMFVHVTGRAPCLHDVQAHDGAHAAYKAWRSAGRSQWPRVTVHTATHFTFDNTDVQICAVVGA